MFYYEKQHRKFRQTWENIIYKRYICNVNLLDRKSLLSTASHPDKWNLLLYGFKNEEKPNKIKKELTIF